MKIRSTFVFLAVFIVVLAMMTQETEARRKILKGRKTITRTYYREPGLPSWAVILIVSLVELIIGGVAFLIMKRFIVDYSPSGRSLKSYN